ncbi:MAG: hypothetical protein ACC650_09125 [Gammaproteobacteria bacterium]
MIKHRFPILIFLLASANAFAEDSPELSADPHYNVLGFFDVHLCNWPERPNFFKVLFSSEQYARIDSMAVYTPDDRLLVKLDKSKFINLKREGKADKHVFISDIDAPENVITGWYRIDINTSDGTHYQAKDYVIMSRLEIVSDMQPSGDDAQALPVTLRWEPVPGAQYYKVFVRDEWDRKLIFKSDLLTAEEITLPDGKLEPGGYYSWSVHARDTNEHILLGDFHMGSMSKKVFFSVAE